MNGDQNPEHADVCHQISDGVVSLGSLASKLHRIAGRKREVPIGQSLLIVAQHFRRERSGRHVSLHFVHPPAVVMKNRRDFRQQLNLAQRRERHGVRRHCSLSVWVQVE